MLSEIFYNVKSTCQRSLVDKLCHSDKPGLACALMWYIYLLWAHFGVCRCRNICGGYKYTVAFWIKPVIYYHILPFSISLFFCVTVFIKTSAACGLSPPPFLTNSAWTVFGCVCLCEGACASAKPQQTFITNGKLGRTMIKCSPAQELIMSNSLSRPSWDHFSGPSWLSRAPRTSWDMWPQQLSPSLPMNPAERFMTVRGQAYGSELSAAAREQEKDGLTVSNSFLFYRTDSQLTSFVHFTITFECSQDFLLLSGLFWMQ